MNTTIKQKIFISHASEDKDDFVRPLAFALQESFEVWYDEFSLKIGDSLRGKIDEALRTCDFGVVIFSPAFFQKKWTVAEVNGLFGLEDTNRKIILPVWHNVTKSDVEAFSPILADRLAASTSKGIDEVVSQIKIAVEVSQRSQEFFNPNAGFIALNKLVTILQNKEVNSKILNSELGVALLDKSTKAIQDQLWRYLESANSPKPRFFLPEKRSYFFVRGPYRISLSVNSRIPYSNTANNACLQVNIFLNNKGFSENETETLEELIWTPHYISETEVAYKREFEPKIFSEKDVVTKLIETYCFYISQKADE